MQTWCNTRNICILKIERKIFHDKEYIDCIFLDINAQIICISVSIYQPRLVKSSVIFPDEHGSPGLTNDLIPGIVACRELGAVSEQLCPWNVAGKLWDPIDKRCKSQWLKSPELCTAVTRNMIIKRVTILHMPLQQK